MVAGLSAAGAGLTAEALNAIGCWIWGLVLRQPTVPIPEASNPQTPTPAREALQASNLGTQEALKGRGSCQKRQRLLLSNGYFWASSHISSSS